MMRFLLVCMIAAIAIPSTTGCVVDNRPRRAYRSAPRCGPAHHWNGHRCVHNGKAKGHHKHKKHK